MTSSDTLDRLARRRAKAKLGWFAHAAVYVAVNLVLIAVSFAVLVGLRDRWLGGTGGPVSR